jgi:hypothetical protein
MQPCLTSLLAACVQKGSQLLGARRCALAMTGTQASRISEPRNHKAYMGPRSAYSRLLSLPHALPALLWVSVAGGRSCLCACILHSCWHMCATDVELRNPVSDIQQGAGMCLRELTLGNISVVAKLQHELIEGLCDL